MGAFEGSSDERGVVWRVRTNDRGRAKHAGQSATRRGVAGYIKGVVSTRRPEERLGCGRMVACATLSAQLTIVSPRLPPMLAATPTIEQLRQQLLAAVENKDSDNATEAIDGLEKASLTKDILESTRIGLTVNTVRRQVQDLWPALSKRCRGLIKTWQKLVEPGPSNSTGSSRNGTPNMVSPAIGRRVTPHTPAGRRVANDSRASTISPANGTPKANSRSPNLHKSQSVGTNLEENGMRNGKRKADDASGSSLKRTKTTAAGLSSLVSPSTPSLSETRRLMVQPTSDLVAQLTTNLPNHMNIEDSLREHEMKVKMEQADEQFANEIANGAANPSPYVFERKKRKYEKKIKAETKPTLPAIAEEERRGGLVLRLPRTHSDLATSLVENTDLPGPSSEVKKEHNDKKIKESFPSVSPTSSTGKVDWLAMLPSLDRLREKAEEERKVREERLCDYDPRKVYLLKVKERDVLALPYVEIEQEPDFLEFSYADPARFYAEEASTGESIE